MSSQVVVISNGRYRTSRGLFDAKWRTVESVGLFKIVQNTTLIDPVFTVSVGDEPTPAESEFCVSSKVLACRRARLLAEQAEWDAKGKVRAAKAEEKAASKTAGRQASLFDKSEIDGIKAELATVKADHARLQAEFDQLKVAVAELASRPAKGRKNG